MGDETRVEAPEPLEARTEQARHGVARAVASGEEDERRSDHRADPAVGEAAHRAEDHAARREQDDLGKMEHDPGHAHADEDEGRQSPVRLDERPHSI